MRKYIISVFMTGAMFAPAAAQTPATAPGTLRLTVDEAVKMAFDHNVDLSAAIIDPLISDTRVAAARGAFRPTVNSSVQQLNQLQPPSSFLVPTATRTDAMTSSAGWAQHLPWLGTSYDVSLNATHTSSNSFLNSFNPLLQSGLEVNLSQPLMRNFWVDPSRHQVTTSRNDRDIAGTRLHEAIAHTTADVKAAYWNLVSAHANVDARTLSLQLSEELMRVNKAKVDVGQSPPLDLVSAQAEVAALQEQLIIAETEVKQAEDSLRLLIFDPTQRDVWNLKIEAVDSPPVGTAALDLEAAVTRALSDRLDLTRARKEIDNAEATVKFTNNQRLPDVRLNASYLASGLGGTEVLRTGGFPGTITGAGAVTNFSTVFDQLLARDYPTWAAGLSISYPIGGSIEQANHARAKLERTQAVQRLKGDEGRVIQQVRDAGWKVEMNAKRIEATRAAREFAEQRLDAERKRFEVGISTSFLVIQAQRDLAQARTNELGAVLAYDLALVDFELLQQAGPSNSSRQQQ
jgi:outer membrane protein